MKKSWFIIILVAVIFVVGIKIINDDSGSGNGGGFSSKLEKELIATLPDYITNCYYIDIDGNEHLNTLEVKNFTIERQTTNGNFKSADCTIEMEGNDVKKTVYVNLSCIKYDDGSWQVEDWSKLSEPKVVPKHQLSETDVSAQIEKSQGFKSLSKKEENIDLENGEIMYSYNVLDKYDYMTFAGDGVSCQARFLNGHADWYEYEYCSWSFEIINNVQIVWDVLGNWHIDGGIDENPPYTVADITINAISLENAGVSSYAYPESNYKGEYLGTYKTFDNEDASCITSGNNPLNAKCEIFGYKSSITITAQGVECSVGDRNYAYKNVTKK